MQCIYFLVMELGKINPLATNREDACMQFPKTRPYKKGQASAALGPNKPERREYHTLKNMQASTWALHEREIPNNNLYN